MVKYYFFTSSYGEEICKAKRGTICEILLKQKNRYRSENTLYLLFIFILLSVPDFLKFSCLISDPSTDH